MRGRSSARVLLATLVVIASGVVPAHAAHRRAGPVVFKGENAEGQVWVDVDLTRHRTQEAYVPLVVAVSNRGKKAAVLDRSSFTIVGADGTEVPLATLEEVRIGYPKLNFDQSMIRVYGMPIGTWLEESRLVPSNFFPAVGPAEQVKLDHVELSPLYWMIDVLYFKTPTGLATGKDVALLVHPKGWKEPVKVVLHV